MLEISKKATISKFVDIEKSSLGSKIIIEDFVNIDSFVKIKTAGGIGDLIVGEFSYINSGCVLYTGNGINIGRNVLVASNCTFAPTNHEYKNKNILIREQGFRPSKGGILIEDDVWIGANSVLLDGATLKKGCIVGAGSIVSGVVAEYTVNAGVPLSKIGVRE